MTPMWHRIPCYDGCTGGWAVRIGQPVKYAVRVGGHYSTIPAHVVEGPFGLDVVPNIEDWSCAHTRFGMPIPPLPRATRARTWWDRFKDGFRGDQNAAVPRVGCWASEIGEIVTPIVAVCRHENGIPVVAEWIAEDATYFAEEEAKLIAAFERERERVREYDEDDDEEHGRRRVRRSPRDDAGRRERYERRREPISLDDEEDDTKGGAPAPF